MQRVVEMTGLEEARDPVDGLVIDQDRAEQRLLRLDIMRRRAENRASPGAIGRISALLMRPTLRQTESRIA